MTRYVDADRVRRELCSDPARPAGTAATLDDEQLLDTVDGASAEVDAALSTAGYRVPDTAPVPRLVAEVTAVLAAYDADHTYRDGAPQGEDEPILRRWRWAQDMLALWAKGERLPAGLGAPTAGEAGDLGVGQAVNPYPQLIGDELLRPVDPFPPDEFYDPDYFRHWTS